MAKEKTTKKSAGKKTATAKSSTKTGGTKKTVTTAKAKAVAAKDIKETQAASPDPKAPVEAKKPVAAKRPNADDATPAGKLAKWFRWLGLAYLVQGLAVLLIGRNVTAPLTMQYPAVDTLASETTGKEVVGIASRHIADVHVEWVLATALLVFAVIHLVTATAYRPHLDVVVARGVNAFRWLSLAVGGGLLVVVTALVSGISSVPMLVVLFGTLAGGALLALGAEAAVVNDNGVKSRLTHFLCGLAALGTLMPWIIFALGVVGAMIWNGKLPGYLYSLYLCQVLLAGAFILATHYRLKRQGKWGDSFYAERGFTLLTFVTVTLLTWQIVVGVLK